MMATANLWPDEIATDGGLEGPATVLKQQAALLGQKTKNLVEAQVESDSDDNSGRFLDRFVVYSTVINYRYELFSVSYPLEFYPARIERNKSLLERQIDPAGYPFHVNASVEVNSREELEEELRAIFSHPKTVRIIQAIMTRSRE